MIEWTDIEIPMMPGTVLDALNLLGESEADPIQLIKVIGRDPGLTARVFWTANSTLLGHGHATADLGLALGRIGHALLRQSLIDVAAETLFPFKDEHYDWKGLWRHSAMTGQIALRIAQWVRPALASEIHIAGLLHDVGIFILNRHQPELMKNLAQRVKSQGQTIPMAEKELFLPTHGALGALAANRWKFPQCVCQMIQFHEARDSSERPELNREDNHLCAIISLANQLSLKFDIRPLGYSSHILIAESQLSIVGISRQQAIAAVNQAKLFVNALLP